METLLSAVRYVAITANHSHHLLPGHVEEGHIHGRKNTAKLLIFES